MSYAGLLNQTLEIFAKTGNDFYGNQEVGAGVSVSARIETIAEEVIDSEGKQKIARSRIFLEPTVSIGVEDKVLLPSQTKTEDVLKVERVIDSGTLHHLEVLV